MELILKDSVNSFLYTYVTTNLDEIGHKITVNSKGELVVEQGSFRCFYTLTLF